MNIDRFHHHRSRLPSLRLMPLIFLAGLGIMLLFPAASASADIGPKPAMTFTFTYQGEPLSIVEARLLQCRDAACTVAQPLESVGPQRFECTADFCYSMAYGYAEYQKLVVTFEDKTRESNVFRKRGFDAKYVVAVSEENLSVRERFSLSFFNPLQSFAFCLALPLTLLIELGVAAIYLARAKIARNLTWVFAANVLSLPVAWFAFPLMTLNPVLIIVLLELSVVLFEALFLYATGRGRGMVIRQAGTLSLLMNTASFALGLLLGTGLQLI